MNVKKIAVLGGGHGGYAACVDFTLRGYEVVLFTFSKERMKFLNERERIICYDGVWGQGSCQIAGITDDMEQAVSGAELIVMAVPGPGHEKYLSELKKYLKKEQVLYMNPGHSGGALRAAHILGPVHRIAEANTLSYIARKQGEEQVYVSSSDKAVKVGVLPNTQTEEVLAIIREVYPDIVAARNVLETTFSNINSMFHPPGMLLNAGWIEHTKGDFRFYYDGITESVGNVVDRMDKERIAVAEAYGIMVEDFSCALYEAGTTTKKGRDSHSAYVACQESEANIFIKAPQQLDHRYMHEDISSGLVPMAELGRVAGVHTPVMDSMIQIADALMGKDYREEGVNLEKMGLGGLNCQQIRDYVNQDSH